MKEQEEASSEVELASLIDEEDAAVPSGQATQPGSSGYSTRDVLLFFLSLAAAIVSVVLILKESHGGKELSVPHDTEASDGAPVEVEAPDGAPAKISWKDMRWRPLSTSDDENCIPGYRLANATIHCGVGGLEPITTDADGTQYCGGVRMEPNLCMMPEEGRWEPVPPAQVDASIPPLHGRFGIDTNLTNDSLPRCESMDQIVNGSITERGEWVPETCGMVPLSPFAWTENTECQATITMLGDSHIRNLLTAMVNGLRGIEFFAESHADDAGKAKGIALAYEWRLHADGSATDRFSVYRNTATKDPTPFEECPCDDAVLRCLRIAFVWAPHFNEQLNQMHFISEWETDLLILEPGNSYEPDVVVSNDWQKRLVEMLNEDEGLHLGILHFPWGNQPVAKDRSVALTQWTTNGGHADRMSYLQQSAINQPNGMQGRKTFHFACGLGQDTVRNDNIAAAEPCTDITDTAQIRALTTFHFGAFSKRRK